MKFKIVKRVVTKTTYVAELEAVNKEDAEKAAKQTATMDALFKAEGGQNDISISVKKIKEPKPPREKE